MGVVFAKTPKGHDEITSKAGGLTPRVRRVLIFVDGRRSVDDLRGMLQSDDLQHTLGMLEEAGYIEVSSVSDANGQSRTPQLPLPAITAFSELPASADPLRLQQARNFMVNTLNTFVGSLGASSLLDRIDQAEGHAGLRALYDEWYHSMVMSREGKREAEALRGKLLQVL
ncbi:hypothetical protein AT959_09815 [Dechloromonas denitrificans]|uniref:Uncharacterized protein n=1 Tax=Dechloromonas denitrificans TaxID=281362 RepID=A0A133XJ68_9RHOO|nr:hypothetical protein [Dechloromonas denitrificans]KXB30992.1 hypothetical protein AT959_09815 [Dechloromonas denitrificans]